MQCDIIQEAGGQYDIALGAVSPTGMRFACLAFPRLSRYSSGNLSLAGAKSWGSHDAGGSAGEHEMGWGAMAAHGWWKGRP